MSKKKKGINTSCTCGYHHPGIKKELPESSIKAMINLAKILQGIHTRLVMEGWKIEPGKFTKPDGTVIEARRG